MKKSIGICMAMLAIATSAFAEQPKASEYRKIFASGKYFVEYIPVGGLVKKSLAVDGEYRTDFTRQQKTIGANIIPFVGGIKVDGKLQPTAIYRDGKYYQYYDLGKKKASMAMYNQLEDENMNPKEAWSTVRIRLSLPEELVTLAPKDIFNSFTKYTPATFVKTVEEIKEAGKNGKPDKKKVYDLYTKKVNSQNGTLLYEKQYRFNYNSNGDLKSIATYIVKDGKEEAQGVMKVLSIRAEYPGKPFDFPSGTKVYAAGNGDMNDLIEQPALIESYEDKPEENATGKDDADE